MLPNIEHYECGDVLIVGAGLAGIFTALKLVPLHVSILAVAPLLDGASSGWAQGGIAAAMSEGDSAENHARDTMIAGCYLNDEHIVKIMTEEASSRVYDLLGYGIPFDSDSYGHLTQGREAAHSHNRIVRVGGDGAGRKIMFHLTGVALASNRISVHAPFALFDLAKNEHGEVIGVYARMLGSEKPVLFTAKYTIFATGGIGHLYADTTNPHQIRGEALGIALRHGAKTRDLEFVQFHPTALDVGRDPLPLATEALRGEGAFLINHRGERFMPSVHPDAELAPRDIVARSVAKEHLSGKVFLDTRQALGKKILTQFPAVCDYCDKAGIDPVSEMIPIKPAGHYHMGGIATDDVGRTSLKGLFALGEVAGTGAHGANRLASNSLLEAIVFSARAADYIKQESLAKNTLSGLSAPIKVDRLYAKTHFLRLRHIMSQRVGILREATGLHSAIEEISLLKNQGHTTAPFENYAIAALGVAKAALERTKSIGSHYRTDEI